MKILHLYAEWKWTGPSEPIVNQVKGLAHHGHSVWLGCFLPPANFPNPTLFEIGLRTNINILPLRRPRKLTALFALIENINRIEKFLHQQPIDLIHCHSSLDHFYAVKAIRHLQSKPKIVRTYHKGIPLQPSLITNYLIKKTDGYITLGEKLLEIDRKTFGLTSQNSWYLPGAIDLTRFNSNYSKNLRGKYGLDENDAVVGIVARIQRHRRFEVLWKAFALAIQRLPYLKLLVVGRGTHAKKLAFEPVKKLGLDKNVIFTGYLKSGLVSEANSLDLIDEYVLTLASFDFGIYLVPGSDGSCRAVREMMAMGKPVIVSQRGILPEIVTHNINGLVIDDTPENLCQAIIALAENKTLRQKLAENARLTAQTKFALEQQVSLLEKIYSTILSG